MVVEGASNVRRDLARKQLRPGVGNSATSYELPVLRKLKPADAQNPVFTLLRSKYTPPYAGSVGTIGFDEFFIRIISAQQITVRN